MKNTRYRIYKVSLKIIKKVSLKILKKCFLKKIDPAYLMGAGDCYRVWVIYSRTTKEQSLFSVT